jgi:dienelactone hydrolase
MKYLIIVLVVFSSSVLIAQEKAPEDFGFRHLQMPYQGTVVDLLVKSRAGEESKEKPLFLFCQGSLPQPLIKYDEKGKFGVFPFNPDSLAMDYHLVIISKPFIPVIAHVSQLNADYSYKDSTGNFPEGYTTHNYLDYYVNRNIDVLRYLQKQDWVSSKKLVVAGHSEGSTIAAKMASIYHKITHLIYSGGNPLGRILTVIEQERAMETSSTAPIAEEQFGFWKDIVANPNNNVSTGDTYRSMYSFSIPPIQYLEKLKIPVLVCYGTKDAAGTYNDYLRIETIRNRKDNFTFKAYIGTEHNYFPVKSTGEIDYETYNWDKVAGDWRRWL